MTTETHREDSTQGMAVQIVNLGQSRKTLRGSRPSSQSLATKGPFGALGDASCWNDPETSQKLLGSLPNFAYTGEEQIESEPEALAPALPNDLRIYYPSAPSDAIGLAAYDVVNTYIPPADYRELSGSPADSHALLLGEILKAAQSRWIVNRQELSEITELEQSADRLRDVATISAARDRLALAARAYERRDHEARLEQLREASSRLARREPRELLNVLAVERGLSWHTVSTMLNVTPTAIRKWRRGGSLTPDNREQLATLVAFFDLLEDVREPIADLGSWIEMRVREDTTLTPATMYARGPGERWLLLEWARGYLDTAMMLGRFDERWRDTYMRDPDFVVGEGPGGERAILPR
jgi:hypothetical protein